MQYQKRYYHCGDYLRQKLNEPIQKIVRCVEHVMWVEEYCFRSVGGERVLHQSAYNKAFEKQFTELGWESQPLLLEKPRLIGDFRKGLVFVEIQFGNSSARYRDYYKFQYVRQTVCFFLAF